jgi:hypothetical protein
VTEVIASAKAKLSVMEEVTTNCLTAIRDRVFPWKRFWSPFGAPIHCEDTGQGFLTDPEDSFGKYHNRNLRALEGVFQKNCFVLCGEPAMGKTYSLRDFIEKHGQETDTSKVIYLEFRSIPDLETFKQRCFQSSKWQNWLQSEAKMSLVIDGLDEGLIRIDRFLPFLTEELATVPRDHLQLALSCRTLDWQRVRNQGEQLLSLWPRTKSSDSENFDPRVFTLCPLRQADAVLAAQLCQIDPSAFIRAARTKGVTSLAARPYTLKMLLQEFASHGSFPASRRQLYENFGLRLCSSEHDPERIDILKKIYGTNGVLSPQQLLKVASRLAASLMLAGKYAIHIGPDEAATASDLPISSLCGFTEEVDGNVFAVDQRSLLDTLATAAFSDRGPDRFGFDHQTMVEALTARYVQHMHLIQLRELFCQRDASGEYVVPQLAQAAAWLAETRHDFFEHVLSVDPETLLRSETTNFTEDNKRRLVEALLEGAKREEIFDDIENYYSGLKHSKIGAQLRPWITDSSLNVVARRMALSIARECHATDLFDDVLQLTKDQTACNTIGGSAIGYTLQEVATEENVPKLIPLARGEAASDPQDDLKGCALHALLRSRWTLKDALPYLTHPKQPNYAGSYEMELRCGIPSRIQREDIIPSLTCMLGWNGCFDYLHPFREIADAVLAESLKHLEDSGIKELAVKVWMKASREYSFSKSDHSESLVAKTLEEHEKVRHALAAAVLDSGTVAGMDLSTCVCYHPYGLLRFDDITWLLQGIETAAEHARQIWAEAIERMAKYDMAAKYLDLLLETRLRVPQLAKRFDWLRAWELDEPMAVKEKASWLEYKKLEEEHRRNETEQPDPRQLVTHDLARIQAGDHTWWVAICNDLYLPRRGHPGIRSDVIDITTWAGWVDSDSQRREELRRGARQFLLKHSEATKLPGRISHFASAGSRALWLLRNEIRGDPELLQAVRQQWIPVLVDGWCNDYNQREEMARLAYEIDANRTREYLAAVIEHEVGGEGGYCFGVHKFRKCWDHTLSGLVKDFILSEDTKPVAAANLIEFLVEVDDEAALECLQSVLRGEVEDPDRRSDIMVGLLSGIFSHALVKHWVVIWPMMVSSPEMAKRVILRAISTGRSRRHEAAETELTDGQIGDVYRLVATLFPPESDLKPKAGVQDWTPDADIPFFRGSILRTLVTRATPSACAVLRQLAEEFPQHGIWIRWQLHEALEVRRRRAWTPPAPQEILTMVKRAALRRVESVYDLAEIVMESLGRLQSRLNRTPNPIVDEFWRYTRCAARREKFSPHYEEDVANRLASWFQDDLNGREAVVIGREIQPHWSQKTDIEISAISRSDRAAKPLTVIIEVKGCWNPGVREDLKGQLADRYLALNPDAVGIYLVGWFVCDRWDDTGDSRRRKQNFLNSEKYEEAQTELENLAAPYNGTGSSPSVTATLIDFRLP